MRKFISFTFVAFCLLFFVPISYAHVEISSTFPEQYTNATPTPQQVWVEFSGPLQTLEGEILNTVEVIDSTGIAVSFGDPVIEGSRITTKVSGQSAPGVFIVKYRVVGEDGHIIEGEYSFSASPDYSDTPNAEPLKQEKGGSMIYVGLIVFGVLVTTLLAGYIIKMKRDISK
jgi:methionine-rich copper-binding protein CopC